MRSVREVISEYLRLFSLRKPDVRADADWGELIPLCDRTQMSLHLDGRAGDRLPAPVRDDLAAKRQRTRERNRRLRAAYGEIAACLDQARIPFVLLKGITHVVDAAFADDLRVQYDLDLLLGGEASRAAQALRSIGYSAHGASSLSDQHLPPLVRPFDFEWKGDYFDPDIPVSIDLHDAPWSSGSDRIELPGVDAMWDRRTSVSTPWGAVPALCPADRLAFAGLHAVRHILRNDGKVAPVYELAWMLERRRDDPAFWAEWRRLHSPAFRQLQVVAFRFAELWFGSATAMVAEEMAALPSRAAAWFERFSLSPLMNLFESNKDAVWLHCALLPSWSDRLRVLRTRLMPGSLPSPSEAVERTNSLAYPAHLWRRGRYHVRALAPTLLNGARWLRVSAPSRTSHISER